MDRNNANIIWSLTKKYKGLLDAFKDYYDVNIISTTHYINKFDWFYVQPDPDLRSLLINPTELVITMCNTFLTCYKYLELYYDQCCMIEFTQPPHM